MFDGGRCGKGSKPDSGVDGDYSLRGQGAFFVAHELG